MTIQDRTPLLAMTKAGYIGPSPTPAAGRGTREHGPHVRPTDWHDAAACKGMPADMFYLKRRSPDGSRAAAAIAKAVCARCTVRESCLADVMSMPFAIGDLGIWGGLSPQERRLMRRGDRRLR